jgi:hypothetical protein
MKQLAWKWNRLRAMSLAEVAHRVQDVVHTKAQTLGWGLAHPGSASLAQTGAPWVAELPRAVDVACHRLAAERILAGNFDVFALHNVHLGFPPEFNRDPKSGTLAPLEFGKELNYRDEEIVGDIKYLWEPNRHLALTTLAQAYHLTGDMRYADGVQRMLDAWFAQCPYPLGANWVSSLELAIRLLNWSVSWHLLGGIDSPLFAGEAGQAFLQRWLDSIYQHCHFIIGYESRDSSANNHLLGELIGLFVASVTWPCWPESAHWQHHAAYELEQQALLQNGPDGVNLEQAIYYQHEVCDMMLFAILLGRANGCPFSSRFSGRLEQMLVFVAAMMDSSGHVSAIGDADDALLVGWNQQPGWNLYQSLLATGAMLFQRADFKAKAQRFDDKSCWLLGDAARSEFEAQTASPESQQAALAQLPQAFAEGGYYILGGGWGNADEVHIVADCGPLGYLSIAAHGHADALAITLSVAGQPILIDPGTFSYHTQQLWRDYFRGTSAHNTVRVDGLDQSEAAGNFLWLRKARAHCEFWSSTPDRDTWVASHDGYMHLPDHVLHRRRIDYDKTVREILVEDILQCHGTHQLEWHWHFAPECELTQTDAHTVRVQSGAVVLEMHLPPEAISIEMIRGREAPPLGWNAPSFDQKVPTTTLRWQESVVDSVSRKIRWCIL